MTRLARATLEPGELRLALRGLPLCEPEELEHAAGFARLVRLLVSAPLLGLGVLAAAAGFAAGHGFLGMLASVTTALIVGALRDDTRINASLELLEKGELHGAEAGMRNVAEAHNRPLPQRQRARGYLVAIAWARADHRGALHWIRARNVALAGQARVPLDERYASLATEVQLLALLGRAEEAATRLSALPPCPPTEAFSALAAQTSLLVAFASDDAESVADRLDLWETRFVAPDRLGFFTTMMAWARDALGQRDAARWLVERVPVPNEFVERHCPRLAQWREVFEGSRRYG